MDTINLEVRRIPEITAMALAYNAADPDTQKRVRDLLGVQEGYNLLITSEEGKK